MSTPEGSQPWTPEQLAALEGCFDTIQRILPEVSTERKLHYLFSHALIEAEKRITQLDRDQIGMAGRMQELEERIDRLQSASGLGRPWNP